MELYSFSFIIWFIHYVNSQSTPCGNQHTPVLRICSNSKLVKDTTVYITTTSVPLLQQTLCKCSINTTISLVNISFSFIEDMLPQSLSFKVNDNEVMSGLSTFTLMDKSMALSVLTSENYTSEGACLKVHSDTPFNIVCYRISARTATSFYPDTSSTVSTGMYIETTTKENNDQTIILIVLPVIGGSLIVVFLVIFVIYMKRRRRTTKKQKSNNRSNPISMADVVPNTGEGGFDIHTYERPDTNAYECLQSHGNDSSGVMYQQLNFSNTRTNFSHHKSQYVNTCPQTANPTVLE